MTSESRCVAAATADLTSACVEERGAADALLLVMLMFILALPPDMPDRPVLDPLGPGSDCWSPPMMGGTSKRTLMALSVRSKGLLARSIDREER